MSILLIAVLIKLLLFGGKGKSKVAADRLKGYHTALTQFGIPFEKELVRSGDYTVDSGYRAILEMESVGIQYSAVICANDLMALGVMNALKELSYRIPDDVQVMGYDNMFFSQYMAPALSTIQHPIIEMGKTAADSVKMATMVGSTEQMKARAQGFVDAMEEHGISVEVLNEYDVTTREEAMASGEDALTTYPDIELIYGVSAQGALGAYDATVGANRTEVMIFGYDGEDEELEVIDGDNNYVGTVTQAPDVEAVTTVEYINKYLAGEEFDKVVPISAGVYCDEGQLSAEEVEEAAK